MTDLYVNFFHFQLHVIPNFLWQMLFKMENLLPCSSIVSIPLYRNPLSELQAQPEVNYASSKVTVFQSLTHTSIAWGTGLGFCNTQFCFASWIHRQCILWEDMAEEKERPISSVPIWITPRLDLSSPLMVQTKANRQCKGASITLSFRHQGAGAISSKICTPSHSASKVNS